MECIIDQKKISDDRFRRYPRAVTCSPECSQISQTSIKYRYRANPDKYWPLKWPWRGRRWEMKEGH